MKNYKLYEIGEKHLVSEIIKMLHADDQLMGGFGHDSAFLDINISKDEVLLINTDRSGLNLAYTMGLDNGNCVGDFGVSHAVSDIFASGGAPICVSIALLLPADTNLNFIKEVMSGADMAAKKYGAFIACGDTKKSDKFAMVVTAIGKCKKDEILTRSNAGIGDFIIATGYFGTMVSAMLAFKNHLDMSKESIRIFTNSLVYQNPPHKIAYKISKAKIANACIDNSDGLSSSIYSLCESSDLGAILYKDQIPIIPASRNVASVLGVDEFQFALASGDWQFIYSVSKNNLDLFMDMTHRCKVHAAIIGEFIDENKVLLQSNGTHHILKRIENDRFKISGMRYFDSFSRDMDYIVRGNSCE
jgi:putative thiamine-phosphate kinase